MVTITCQLPQIERPSEEILEAESKEVLAAFEIILNGYKRAQKRTLAITKAYNELESIVLDILKKHGDKGERNEDLPFEDEIYHRNKCLTPRAQNCQLKKKICSKEIDEMEIIDLAMSPVLTELGNDNSGEKKSPVKESPENNFASTSKWAKTPNKNVNSVQKVGNDENRPPLVKNSSVKITLAKGIYNVEKSKTSNRKSLKQATLTFQPIAEKLDLSLSEKESMDKSQDWDDLFDEDYRVNKNLNNKQGTKTDVKYSTRFDEASSSKIVTKKTEAHIPKNNDKEEQIPKKTEITIEIPSEHQINETSRSLFDDEDADNFEDSPDILYTCVETSAPANVSQPVVNNERLSVMVKEPDMTTSKACESVLPMDSMDETFFAPAEIKKKDEILPGTSRNSKNDDPCTSHRASKEKRDGPRIDEAKEFEDLALQDINWETDMFHESVPENCKQPFNNSFDIPPEKRKRDTEVNVERNKAKRSKLQGWSCWQCQEYYENMGLSEAELKKKMNMCSRHRNKFNPRYYTPKGFWNPEFPDGMDSSDSESEKNKI